MSQNHFQDAKEDSAAMILFPLFRPAMRPLLVGLGLFIAASLAHADDAPRFRTDAAGPASVKKPANGKGKFDAPEWFQLVPGKFPPAGSAHDGRRSSLHGVSSLLPAHRAFVPFRRMAVLVPPAPPRSALVAPGGPGLPRSSPTQAERAPAGSRRPRRC